MLLISIILQIANFPNIYRQEIRGKVGGGIVLTQKNTKN